VASDNSFEAVARAWHGYWKATRSDNHVEYVLRRLEADVFPEIGHRAIADLKATDFVRVAKKIEARGALDIAKRALQTSGQIMRYAVGHGLIERNPVADVKPGDVLIARKKVNYARVDAKDLPELLRKMQAYDGSPYTRFALQLIALTFVRTTELIEARWSEFDLDAAEWRIPAERMKMKTPHIVPLSTQAVDALRCLQEVKGLSDLVFPGERDHEKPMSNNTILKAQSAGPHGLQTPHDGPRLSRHRVDHLARERIRSRPHRAAACPSRAQRCVRVVQPCALSLAAQGDDMQWWADHLDVLRKGAKVLPLKAA
jgi:integrase